MSDDDKLIKVEVTKETRRRENEPDPIKLGDWYWLENFPEEGRRMLGCVVHVGSNYASCTPEPNPDEHIHKMIAMHQGRVNELLDKVKQLTASLGIGRLALDEAQAAVENKTQALVAVHGTKNVQAHKKALIKAKEKTLPELFKKVKQEHEKMALWMKAQLKPYEAEATELERKTGAINDRIFTVELYAGLIEEMVQIRKGDPAPNDTKVSLFQRRHYMDEECLVNYEAGGMEFKNLAAFDRWLMRKDNLARVLPLQRCVVAFRVRRMKKKRYCYSIGDFFHIRELEKLDKSTFLYIRNGQQVWRLITGVDFGHKLFPNKEDSLLLGDKDHLWANVYWSRVEEIISDDEMQQKLEDYAVEQEAYEVKLAAWKKEQKKPEKERKGSYFRPSSPSSYRSEKWVKIDKESVYYDDVMMRIAQEAMAHNRVAVVLQGVLDRSPALHPHPPWQLWTPEGFIAGIELIYDESKALTCGEAPDFEYYRQLLNEKLGKGCFTVGQQGAWLEAEREKEERRSGRDRDWWTPYGNPGPGRIAQVQHYSKKNRTCTFRWERKRERARWVPNPNRPGYQTLSYDGGVPCRFICSKQLLLNVSAYTPGDFKQFYADPRTRADYAEWAPMLLAAEDWHHEQAKEKKKKK
jgi:hypothetical protein